MVESMFYFPVLEPKGEEMFADKVWAPGGTINNPPPGPGKALVFIQSGVSEKACGRPYLEAGSLTGILLVVQHCLQNFLVTPRNQAHSAQDFQHGHLCFNVLCAQTLSDHINTLRVSQDMGPALRVVHQCLYTANEGGMYPRLRGLVVHRLQEVENTGQAIQIDEPGYKPARKRSDQSRPFVLLYPW